MDYPSAHITFFSAAKRCIVFDAQKEVMDRINLLYLGGYFNKYNFQLHSFDASGNPYKGRDTLHLNYFTGLFRGDTTDNDALHYISDSIHNYSYVSAISLYRDSQ